MLKFVQAARTSFQFSGLKVPGATGRRRGAQLARTSQMSTCATLANYLASSAQRSGIAPTATLLANTRYCRT